MLLNVVFSDAEPVGDKMCSLLSKGGLHNQALF